MESKSSYEEESSESSHEPVSPISPFSLSNLFCFAFISALWMAVYIWLVKKHKYINHKVSVWIELIIAETENTVAK